MFRVNTPFMRSGSRSSHLAELLCLTFWWPSRGHQPPTTPPPPPSARQWRSSVAVTWETFERRRRKRSSKHHTCSSDAAWLSVWTTGVMTFCRAPDATPHLLTSSPLCPPHTPGAFESDGAVSQPSSPRLFFPQSVEAAAAWSGCSLGLENRGAAEEGRSQAGGLLTTPIQRAVQSYGCVYSLKRW